MSNLTTICGGSVVHNGKSHTEFNFRKLNFYMKNNPNATDAEILAEIFPKEIEHKIDESPMELIKELLNQWKYKFTIIHSVGFLHAQISSLYNNIIDNQNFIDVTISDTEKPGNYSEHTARLSNTTWKNYQENKIQGFCPCEPMVRLKQLADFPIQQFTDGEIVFDIESMDIPKAPEKDLIDWKDTSSILDKLELVKPKLLEYEKYYKKLIPLFETTVKEIMIYNSRF